MKSPVSEIQLFDGLAANAVNNPKVTSGTRVAGLFPNERPVLHLVTAMLMETSEEWKTGRTHLSPTTKHNTAGLTENQPLHATLP